MNQTAPIASLPSEVLADIFEELHASQQAEQTYPLTKRSEMVISHVTIRWRSVALGSPKLWTQIPRISGPKLLGHAQAYLERSKTLPIDLDVRWERNEPTQAYYHLLGPHIDRCRHLRMLASAFKDLIAQINIFSAKNAPFLQSMELVCTASIEDEDEGEVEGEDENFSSPDVLSGGAPLLSAVHVVGIPLSRCIPLQASKSITVMCLERLDRDALLHAPNLVHLMLDQFQLADEVLDPASPITLAHLKTLSIDVSDAREGQFATFFMLFSAPSLETLYLRHFTDNDFNAFPPAKFPALRHLVINSYISHESISELAIACSNITHLTFIDHPQLGILHAYTVIGTMDAISDVPAPRYWQKLHTLSLPTYSDAAVIEDVVLARRELGAPLQKIVMKKDDGQWPSIISGVCSNGVKLEECKDPIQALFASWKNWSSWG